MTTPPEALREMGAEFHHAAAKCDDALHALESARRDRITFLREAIKRKEERLSDIKEEVRRLPEQIAKWEAERARLELQTGLDLLRAVVAERGENPAEPPVCDNPFVPGLPPLRLREVWAEWEDDDGDVVTFKGERYRYSSWPSSDADQLIGDGSEWSSQNPLRPHGATWEHVKRLAEKKESGPLKVGDRVEVPDGVRELVHEGAIPPGQYEVTRVWDDDVEIQGGSVRYLVRDSDVRRV